MAEGYRIALGGRDELPTKNYRVLKFGEQYVFGIDGEELFRGEDRLVRRRLYTAFQTGRINLVDVARLQRQFMNVRKKRA